MTDLGPNTHPGYCPVCSMKADIWNDTRNAWECYNNNPIKGDNHATPTNTNEF